MNSGIIDYLDSSDKTLLLLHFHHGFTYPELAEIFNVPTKEIIKRIKAIVLLMNPL
jgi:DNA-directed RNA polymerase specialized sigma24 family protein